MHRANQVSPFVSAHASRRSGFRLFSKLFFLTLAAAVQLCLFTPQVFGQQLYGTIVGTVTDSSGALVPNADVTATNTETGTVLTTTSNGSGAYNIGNVPAGTYQMSIKKTGFSSFADPKVVVAFNGEVRVNASLPVGTENSVVTVSADAPELQTDRADVHTNITSKQFEDLPQPTRNYEVLVGLSPGVNPPSGGFAGAGGTNNPGRSSVVEANGTSNSATDVRIDGVSAVNPWVQYYSTAVPSTEAIQAVNVVTGTPDAEQGLASGATINVQIKSGTNTFHGSAYEFHQDNVLKARPYSFNAAQVTARKPKLIDNDFGGTFGGPILHNKLFFFGSYEGDFTSQQGTALQTVPSGTSGSGAPTGERAGDFSHAPGFISTATCNNFALSTAARSGCIYDPAQTTVVGGVATQVAFPNNIIPASRLSPITQQLVALLPSVSNVAGSSDTNNYYSAFPNKATLHKIDTKITWDASPKLRLAGSYSQYPYSGTQVSTLGAQLGGGNFFSQYGDTYATTIAASYLASEHFLIDGSFGFTRAIQNLVPPRANELAGSDTLRIPGTNLGTLPSAGGLPQFNISNFSSYGYSYPFLNYTDPVLQYAANASLTKGKHSIKFGTLISQQRINHIENNPTSFGFNGGATAAYGGTVTQSNSYADFLLGAVNNRTNSQIIGTVTMHSFQYSGYLRDQWQVSRDLTVSYGTGYEYYPVPNRGNGRGIEHYDFTTNTYMICGAGGTDPTCGVTTAKDLFTPRLGVAYRPTDKTVIRAGFGIAREQLNMFRDGLYNYPVRLGYTDSAANQYIPVSYIQQGIPVLAPPAAGVSSIPLTAFPKGLSFQASTDLNFIRGYVESYNLTVQRDLGAGWILSTGYVGTHTVHQHTRYNTNAGMVLGAGANGQYFYTLPTPGATSPTLGVTASEVVVKPAEAMTYNSLQTTIDKNLSRGFQLHVAYTWSKWLAVCCDTSGDGGPQVYIPQFFYRNHVASPGDIRHNVVIASIYELPFGKGKAFLTRGIGAKIAGGWQANTVIGLRTGLPFNITANNAPALNAPNNTQTPDLIAPIKYLGGHNLQSPYIDTSSFKTVPAATGTGGTGVYRFGTLGLETARAPKFANVDFSVFRTFPVYERASLQLRIDTLNLFNHPNFGAPNGNADGGATFGYISSTNPGTHLVSERYFRLGAKVFF